MALLPTKANTKGNSQTLDDRTPLPVGDYMVHIVESEFKETKNKDGSYLALRFKVIQGDHKGKLLFVNLNLDNKSPVAVEIANKELNSICAAVGLFGVEDSLELHGKPFMVSVSITKSKTYGDGNAIRSYFPVTEGSGMLIDDREAVPEPEVQEPGTETKEQVFSKGFMADPDTGKLPWE